MLITNIRLGHATNSSSSHSLVFMSDGYRPTPQAPYDANEYGWDNFTLTSVHDKLEYLSTQLAQNLTRGWDAEKRLQAQSEATRIIHELTGQTVTLDKEAHVDHQSQWSLPLTWNESEVHTGFLAFLADLMQKDEVVVLGGNDNDEPHPDHENGKEIDVPTYYKYVAREDTAFWTLFNRETGAKIRISKNNAVAHRAHSPELVDIKITDYCPFACAFCYQGSTRAGRHATLDDITLIANRLAEAEVFEVAIGGGEPTLHPDFAEILRIFSDRHIIPNFTTRNKAWIKEGNPILEAALASGSAVAFSCEDEDTAFEVVRLNKAIPGEQLKLNFHYVMGLHPLAHLENFLEVMRETWSRVTLLGYKTTGRGQDVTPYPYSDWVALLTKMQSERRCYDVSIDTTLAQQSRTELSQAVPSTRYHTEEGAFSAYIDAVAKTLAPSSYEPARSHVPFDEDWLMQFGAWKIDPSHEEEISGQIALRLPK